MKLQQLFEQKVPKLTDPSQAALYADKQGKRVPELEPIIMKDPYWAVHYAMQLVNNRWPEAEPSILTSPDDTLRYLWFLYKLNIDFSDIDTKPPRTGNLRLGLVEISDIPNSITKKQLFAVFKMSYTDINTIDVLVDILYDDYNENSIKMTMTWKEFVETNPLNLPQLGNDFE